MNLAHARIVLRPRTVAETLDLALRWQVQVGGATYLRLSLLVLLPCALGCFALQYALGWSWEAVWWCAVALTTVVQGVFTVAASQMMFEPHVSAAAVLRTFARRLPTFFGALLLRALYLSLTAVVVVVLPWGWARVLIVHEAVLLEQSSAVGAMRRSIGFAKGHYVRIFGLWLGLGTAMLAAVLFSEVAAAALFEFVLQVDRPFGDLAEGGSLMTLLGLFASVPFVASAQFLFYIDARTRRDGWDIQLSFLAIASGDRKEPGL